MSQEDVLRIMSIISTLDPSISNSISEEKWTILINLASSMVSEVIIPEKKDLAIALIALDLATTANSSNMSRKKIGDVEISYYDGATTSKWRLLYESMLAGAVVDDYSIFYVGI